MQQHILAMLQLQDSINNKIHSQWKTKKFQWYRAIWIEAAELMDHYGWKWWKKQTSNIEQVKLEMIDIWHFGLSSMLEKEKSSEKISEEVYQVFLNTNAPSSKENLLSCTENFAKNTLMNCSFDVEGFFHMMSLIDMSLDELYCGYIGKNVLNFFRQTHGYQEGHYKKIWGNKEDNEHLVEIISTLDHKSPNFQQNLYHALDQRYNAMHCEEIK